MNLQEKDYNAVIEIAAKALTELGVPKEVIGKCAEILAKDKEKVLHKWFYKFYIFLSHYTNSNIFFSKFFQWKN